ncbi:DSD1 family PLP-dependent enzyme [Microbacteriaceae bacterium K1510]|nr:DSD1 family PLP-dependent enzyme [Microbacteriaceae bacterium K1510]
MAQLLVEHAIQNSSGNGRSFLWGQIDTPALLVDLDVFDVNMRSIIDRCVAGKVGWRPHCKSHKCPDVAKLLIAAGAIGLTCSKLSEAEAMVDAGIADILIANQIVGPLKISRLMQLRKRADIIVAVDNVANVEELAHAASKSNVRLRIVIEINSGMNRAGVEPCDDVVALATRIASFDALHFSGLMTWEGHTSRIADAAEKRRAIESALANVVRSAEACRAAGLKVDIVSCGGTGTFETAALVPGITEIQAGGGVFGGVHYRELYHVPLAYGLTVLSTVTSRPTPRRVICDAGKKAMSSDAGVPFPLDLPSVEAVRLSAEHGVISLSSPSEMPLVGDRIRFVVGYADTTVHLHDKIYAVREGRIEYIWRIPRGARLR